MFVMATKMTIAAKQISPIHCHFLVVLEPILLKTKFEPKNIITILICIAGMVLFFFGKLEMGSIYGNLIAIGAGLCFAMFSLLIKFKKVKHKSENTISSAIIGNAIVAVIAFFIIYPGFSLTTSEAFCLLYMGSIQIGISYMIFNEGIKYVSATESMIIAMLEAIFNPIWVFIGIGEKPSIFSIIGAAIIFGAILWRNFSRQTVERTFIVE
jgi:drug/metabolite transporter (DMT)-like permease